MMQPQTNVILIGDLGHTLQAHHAPNRIPRLQIRNVKRLIRIGFNQYGRVNKKRQDVPIEQEIKQMANGLIRLIPQIQKALLMNVKRTHQIFMKRIHFHHERGMIRDVHTKTGGFRIVIHDTKGWRQNADIVEIDGVVFVREFGDGFTKAIHLKGIQVNMVDFKCLIWDGENHSYRTHDKCI